MSRSQSVLACVLSLLTAISAGADTAHRPPRRAASRHSNPAPRVPAGPIHFEDIAKQAGLNSQLTCGSPEKRYILEAMCGGAAFFDYDNDGWADSLSARGSPLEESTP